MADIDFKTLELIVRTAGNSALQSKKQKKNIDYSQPDNIHSQVDLRLHDFYLKNLPKILDVPILSEEDSGNHLELRPEVYWIIDPLDGTLSYLNNFLTYVTQIALMVKDMPEISYIFAPESSEMFRAIRNKGAFLNDQSIKVSASKCPEKIIDNYPIPIPYVSEIMKKLKISEYLESGSIGLKICRVADGTADIFVKQTRVYDWDVAPGALILQEAGGQIGLLSGAEYKFENALRKENFQAFNQKNLLDLEKFNL